jgi:predicted transcriptional regulator
MRRKLLFHIHSEYGTQAEAAKAWGMSQANVSTMVLGKRPPNKVVLKALGLMERKVVIIEYFTCSDETI